MRSAQNIELVNEYHGHLRSGLVYALAWSPDGSMIASAAATSGSAPMGTVKVAAAEQQAWSTESISLKAPRPLKPMIVSEEKIDNRVHIWDSRTGRRISYLRGHRDSVTSLDFSHLGPKLLSASNDGTVRAWQVRRHKWRSRLSWTSILVFDGHLNDIDVSDWDRRVGLVHVDFAAWSPTGRKVVSIRGSRIKIWDHATATIILSKDARFRDRFGGFERRIMWSPDGARIAWNGMSHVCICDAQPGGELLEIYARRSRDFSWSPDGQHIVAAGDGVELFDAATGEKVQEYENHGDGDGVTIHKVAWSPNGRFIAAARNDGSILIWCVVDEADVYAAVKNSRWVSSLAWSPDGLRIASGGVEGIAYVWQVV